jgi:acetyl-CoA/propionyl-CoA carboxylase biotin carboxyl carrier protein
MAAGIRWVGPPPDAIRAMGDKAAARRLANAIGVPVLPGYDEPDQSDGALMAAAASIGYPLVVKPAAGGGGKGMRVVREPDALSQALSSARREAMAAFGDDRLILERYLDGPRHVEVQVLFDGHGNGVHLGERDCSIQRRHQKVLEETPSPGIDESMRRRMADAALALARAVGYVSAGTCEFLVDDRGGFHFLEMNTRLQVEHPVTELVTGRDLVADQLHVAGGEPLGFEQRDVRSTGHAVEARLYAEDAEGGFLPATGRIEALRWPGGDGIRVDAGIRLGDEVGGRFDPLLAKIVAHGPDRLAALARLAGALDDTVVLGLVTNLRFLRWLVREPVVLAGEARIDTLERIWPPDDWQERTAVPAGGWAVAAGALVAAGGDDAWEGGWRLNAPPTVRLAAEGQERSVRVPRPATAEPSLVRVGEVAHVDVGGRSVAVTLATPPDVDRAARSAGRAHAGAPADLVAPMPGRVLAVHVSVGGALTAGQPVITLEAMKMEHVVPAPIDGRLGELLVEPGDQVSRGQSLGTVEP